MPLIVVTITFVGVIALSACARLDVLVPNIGPQRTLVEVEGETRRSFVIWDAGAPSEATLPGGFLSASIFTVPDGASPGVHQVALAQGKSRTRSLPFRVIAPRPFTQPRVDRISLAYTEFAGGDVTVWLYVQAANGDVGAEVLVNGAVQPTITHKGLRNNLLGVAPVDLSFPIYHWVTYITPWSGSAGSQINISVRNTDGRRSLAKSYHLPDNADSLDSDGDDIPDIWEVAGYDADEDGTIDVDLPGLGADPYRPDLFVEIDVMEDLDNPPTAATWTGARDVFAAAPVINPGDEDGINLVIDSSGSVPFWNVIDFNIPTVTRPFNQADFYDLKATNFPNAERGRIYHYGIWANARPDGYSGKSDVDFGSGEGGDDFIISFDDFNHTYHTEKSRIETFVHELGHNLGLRHGGVDHDKHLPNHNSVMSYSWQLRTGHRTSTRQENPIYGPFYYLTPGLDETAGVVPTGFSNLTSYSDGMGRNLQENCLDETVGLWGGRAIDWNRDGDSVDVCAVRDLNEDGDSDDRVTDFPSWANITFTGPRTNGDYGS